jgi:excisionase family DNA binding protein
MAMDKTLLVSVPEAARCLGIAEKTVRNWMSAGKFPVQTVRLGARRLVRRADLELFVDGLGVGQSAAVVELDSIPIALVKRPRGRPRKSAGANQETGYGEK